MLFATRHPAQSRLDFGHPTAGSAAWVRREEAIMGTSISVELWCEKRSTGDAAVAAVIDEMHRIDRTMSPHRPDSELSRINREAATQAVPLSDEMARLIERAMHFSHLSGGAFDISYAGVGQLYDYRAGTGPSDEQLAQARRAVGWRHLQLNPRARTLRFGLQGMRIDLGGFAKGHAVDNACRMLRRLGIRHAMVAAGGDSRVMGERGNRPWTIAIRDPRRASEVVAVLPLQDTSISTSGDYERYFERDGQRHHHIVDPSTGRSPSSLRSVTILGTDGITCEALSKSVFVLGVERGLALVETMNGVDAVLIDDQGRLHRSSGLLDGHAARA
jgi:thiamine biosynthesis lipoprotein